MTITLTKKQEKTIRKLSEDIFKNRNPACWDEVNALAYLIGSNVHYQIILSGASKLNRCKPSEIKVKEK